MNQSLVFAFIIAVFILGGLFYIYYPQPIEYTNPEVDKEEEQIFCTQDAKLCPDGSYVGRVPPDCQFEACPIPPDAIFEDGTILE